MISRSIKVAYTVQPIIVMLVVQIYSFYICYNAWQHALCMQRPCLQRLPSLVLCVYHGGGTGGRGYRWGYPGQLGPLGSVLMYTWWCVTMEISGFPFYFGSPGRQMFRSSTSVYSSVPSIELRYMHVCIASTSPGLSGTVPPDGLLPLSRYGIGIIPEVLEYLIV